MTVNELLARLSATVAESPQFGEAIVRVFEAYRHRPGDILEINGIQVYPMVDRSSSTLPIEILHPKSEPAKKMCNCNQGRLPCECK